MENVSLYVVTFNSPPQLQLLLDNFARSSPELLTVRYRFIIDNSSDVSTCKIYDLIAVKYGFQVIRRGNLGISGARLWAAKHFNRSSSEFMLWFEDDMLLLDSVQLCKNGLNQHVSRWLEKCITIIDRERLDFLKLSFSEVYGDHHDQWSWYNLSSNERDLYFPDGAFTMKWSSSGSVDGLSYLLGEVFYSNWPSIMTLAGNYKIFLSQARIATEQEFMCESFKMIRAGTLKSGVLIASLVNHERTHFYNEVERKES